MKPGATTRFVASIVRFAERPASLPADWIAAMRPSATQTSARNQGAPVPSTILPPVISRSQGASEAEATAGAARARARRSEVGRMGGH